LATIAEQISKINNEKQAQRSAFTAQGINMTNVPFVEYHTKIPQLGGGTVVPPEPIEPLDPIEVYNDTRPSDWLKMPAVNQNEIYLLFHLSSPAENLVAFTVACTGSYTVQYGTVNSSVQFVPSGSVSIVSGNICSMSFSYNDWPSNVTSSGIRQVMIKISGTDITSFTPSTYLARNYTGFAAWNIVEFKGNLPSCTYLVVGAASLQMALNKLRYFSLEGNNQIDSFSRTFQSCSSLVSIPQLYTGYNAINFSYMFYGCYSLTSIPQLDTSLGTNFSNMFVSCSSLSAIPPLDTGNNTNFSNMFNGCSLLQAIPQLNTGSGTDFSNMFYRCLSLQSIPLLDTGLGTNFSNMFTACSSLQAIPQLDTNKGINFSSMFNNCPSLQTIPPLNTGSGTDFNNMFANCSSLQAIPQLNTRNSTTFYSMFQNCYSLITIPLLDCTRCRNFSYMFYGCYSLTSVPQLDISHATIDSMNNMFTNCYSLTTIPLLDTSNCLDLSYMFNGCISLRSIPQLNTDSCTNFNYMFNGCYSLMTIPQLNTSWGNNFNNMFANCYSLTSLIIYISELFNATTPFTNCYSLTSLKFIGGEVRTTWPAALSLQYSSMTATAIEEFFNTLPTITISRAITLTNTPAALTLTAAQRAIATNKNWTLVL